MRYQLRCLGLAAILATAMPAMAADARPLAKAAGPGLLVGGKVEHAFALDADALRRYPPEQVVELQLPGRALGDQASKVRGVRLKALVEQAKIVIADHNTVKKTVVVASARDGYTVVFSWSELFNAELGDSVLVLFERDGKPLPDDEGPLAMISARDIKTGPRHVKWLERVDIKQVAD